MKTLDDIKRDVYDHTPDNEVIDMVTKMIESEIIQICEDLIKNSTIRYDSTGAGDGFVPPYALIDLRNALREYYIETVEIAGCKE